MNSEGWRQFFDSMLFEGINSWDVDKALDDFAKLEKAHRELWLFIEEHGGTVLLAHATQIMRIKSMEEE